MYTDSISTVWINGNPSSYLLHCRDENALIPIVFISFVYWKELFNVY